MSAPENPLAFPEVVTEPSFSNGGDLFSNTFSCGGMTLRDYFAAKALAASFAGYREGGMEQNLSELAMSCFAIADAMLVARSKEATS